MRRSWNTAPGEVHRGSGAAAIFSHTPSTEGSVLYMKIVGLSSFRFAT